MPISEPPLNADDIQGNVLPGFRRDLELFVGFTLTAGADLKPAMAAVASHVTPLSVVLQHKDTRKAAFLAGLAAPPSDELWLSVAMSLKATDAAGLPGVADLDAALGAGMIPSRTGDPRNPTLPDGRPNPAHPKHWEVGGPAKPLDLLLIFACDADIETRARPIIDAVAGVPGLAKIYEERGALLPGDVEHFGFQDGVSQPGLYGLVEVKGRQRPITTRYGVPSRGGFDFGKPGQPLAWPTQFLVGIPDETGVVENVDPALRNGSLMVFRRLLQDVPGFYADTEAMSKGLMTGEELRARIVGRRPSGQPLMRPLSDPASEPEGFLAINHFLFANEAPALHLTEPGGGTSDVAKADPDPEPFSGLRCPAWAHVRKVNPRDLPTNRNGPPETLGFQMLRRGIPFGPAYNHQNPEARENALPRGLLFVAYQRSITNQFEILNSDWMNGNRGPTPGGFDLLVGQQLGTDSGLHDIRDAQLRLPGGVPPLPITAPVQRVIPTGGAYLFTPSVRTLRVLGGLES